jgi:tRNA threonylcarbamoyladenosine biosynthesis protein TsaB
VSVSPRDNLILSIETATLAGSISISSGQEILQSSTRPSKESHSNTLLADIDALLGAAKIELNQIDLFAVAVGPGSFTGLRIGIATTKALAVTLNRPCVGIPTLNACARSAGKSDASVALLPAGRGEVFAQLFRVSADLKVIPLDVPSHISPEKMLEKYDPLTTLTWVGEGAQLYQDLISATGKHVGSGWRLAPPVKNLAEQVALLAYEQWIDNQVQTVDSVHALYVRPSDAELKK